MIVIRGEINNGIGVILIVIQVYFNMYFLWFIVSYSGPLIQKSNWVPK